MHRRALLELRAPSRISSVTTTRRAHRNAQLRLSDAQRQTIFALSSPPGKAGVGVIRVSGPDAQGVWSQLVRTPRRGGDPGTSIHPVPWKMQRCKIVHPRTHEILDDGLAVFFKGPRSFTTEDVLELHIHSGRAIIAAILTALSTIDTCRPAEPGEFTCRAFLGGRMDLTQVEGLRDLLEAETDTQRRLALRAAGGDVRSQFEGLRTKIIHCLAMVEALIDFGEGEEIEEGIYSQAQAEARSLLETIYEHLRDSKRGEILRTGIRLAIFGPPNAGKSSLLNYLAQREAAIVTPVPGTTRDIIELSLDIHGLPVIVSDTAGLRKTEDIVESIGIERTKKAVQEADVSICVLSLPEVMSIGASPSGVRPASNSNETTGTTGQENWRDVLSSTLPASVASLISPNTYFLLNKSDIMVSPLSTPTSLLRVNSDAVGSDVSDNIWQVSLHTGQGTETFLNSFARSLKSKYDILQNEASSDGLHHPLITQSRHRIHLDSAANFLEAFIATPQEDVVLGAEELRYAAQAVGKITGLIDVEEVLDAVFKDFCIGK